MQQSKITFLLLPTGPAQIVTITAGGVGVPPESVPYSPHYKQVGREGLGIGRALVTPVYVLGTQAGMSYSMKRSEETYCFPRESKGRTETVIISSLVCSWGSTP